MQKDRNVKDWLMQPGNNFCALPYMHMAIEANGDIRPCCMGSVIKNDDGSHLNITGKTIGEVYDDPNRHKFIDSFDKNEQHPACSKCWKNQSENSPRIKFSTNTVSLDYTKKIMEGGEKYRALEWLEVKPGNRCNLKCRICGIHNSSLWTKDEYEFKKVLHPLEKPVPFKESKEYKYTKQCEWIDQDDFWGKIESLASVKMIHFMGGEPFMVPEHFQLLEEIIARKDIDQSDIIVRYNTNGTMYPTEEQLEILSKFKFVDINISIDDTGKRFEYQRHGMAWETVSKNIYAFKQLPYRFHKWFVVLDPTINIHNILYLEEYEQWANDLGFEMGPRHRHYVQFGQYNARMLPEEMKKHITEMYRGSDSVWINNAMEFLNAFHAEDDDVTNLNGFWIKTRALDKMRNEKFEDVFPELNALLEKYGKKDDHSQ
jgi:radical SAM protein with 4Fe4S-binding SPASM domain